MSGPIDGASATQTAPSSRFCGNPIRIVTNRSGSMKRFGDIFSVSIAAVLEDLPRQVLHGFERIHVSQCKSASNTILPSRCFEFLASHCTTIAKFQWQIFFDGRLRDQKSLEYDSD